MSSWNMKPNTGGGDWELPPAGNLAAVCVALIDLGTQQESFQGKPREARQLAIVWELSGMVNTKTGKNHVVCNKFNASLHQKSNLRKIIDSWRGTPLKDDEEFDLFKVVGAACLLQVSHDKTTSGSDIYSIDAVASLVKGMAKPAPTFPLIKYSVSDGINAIPSQDWLPHLFGRKIPEVIRACVEFRSSAPPASAPPASEADDTIPF